MTSGSNYFPKPTSWLPGPQHMSLYEHFVVKPSAAPQSPQGVVPHRVEGEFIKAFRRHPIPNLRNVSEFLFDSHLFSGSAKQTLAKRPKKACGKAFAPCQAEERKLCLYFRPCDEEVLSASESQGQPRRREQTRAWYISRIQVKSGLYGLGVLDRC